MAKIREDATSHSYLLVLDYNKSKGSGFQLAHNGYSLLVTAKHVLFDENDKLRCEHLRIMAPNSDNIHLSPRVYEIEMDSRYVTFHPTSDVCCVMMGKMDEITSETRYNVLPLENVNVTENENCRVMTSRSHKSRIFEDIRVANDVYMFGYPTSLGISGSDYFDIDKPLLRKGVVSGINKRNKTFIIDCASFYGNSGSPVVEGTDQGMALAGLVSTFIPLEINWFNQRDRIKNTEYANSGYTVCISMVPIIETCDLCIKNLPDDSMFK